MSLALASLAFGVWAMTAGKQQSKRAVAKAIRAAAGPPRVDDANHELGSDTPASASTEPRERPAEPATPLDPALFGPAAPPPRPPRPRGLRGVSFVLALGFDNRSDKVTGRTDTMIIGAFRERDGKVAAFSVPRDLWIEIPELGPARISSVYRIGEVKLGPGRGLPLLRDVLEREFGLRIDHYAGVDLAAFVELVDAVGGIDVDVQCPIVDCFWLEPGASSCTMLDLPAGRQHLDGQTALMFARSRHGRGDRDRTRRQQAVIVAFARKVMDRGLRRLPSLWERTQPHLRTDLDFNAAAYYASFALETPLSDIGGFAITKPLVERHITEDNKHVLLLNREAFDDALDKAFETRLPALKTKRRCPAADVALRVPAR